MSHVLVLVASIPKRRHSCERVLAEIARQFRPPDAVVLVLDGYGDEPAPACPLPVAGEHRTTTPKGAGNRWLCVLDLLQKKGAAVPAVLPDDVVVCLDDDVMLCEAPGLIDALVRAVEDGGGAAGAMGRTVYGDQAPPGRRSCGDLIHSAGCGLAVRAGHLVGLPEFAVQVLAAGGPDTLGMYGDDDAIVSAFLWKNKIRILHAPTGNIYEAPGMQATSQTVAREARGDHYETQKQAVARVTGWPWLSPRSANG